MCGGRVSLEMIFESLIEGADGVFIGTCLRGECHYSTGNLQVEVRVMLAKQMLRCIGLNPDRVLLAMMSLC